MNEADRFECGSQSYFLRTTLCADYSQVIVKNGQFQLCLFNKLETLSSQNHFLVVQEAKSAFFLVNDIGDVADGLEEKIGSFLVILIAKVEECSIVGE